MMIRKFKKVAWLICAIVCCDSVVYAEVEGVPYKVKIHGARGDVKKSIKDTTVIWKHRKRLPSTEGQLRRRIERDIPTIETILEANGFYDGSVWFEFDTDRTPIRVHIYVEKGEQYRYRDIRVRYIGEPDRALRKIKPIIRRKKKVVAKHVFEEQQRISHLLTRNGYPFPVLEKRSVTVDREEKVIDVELLFNPGQKAYFGGVDIEGLTTLSDGYIQRQLPWREGNTYDAQKVIDFEKKMLGTGLFGSVRMSPEESAGNTNTIPISMSFSERTKRTIRLGFNYSDIGPGVKVYWEHRSLFGEGERLETSVAWDEVKYGVQSRLTRSGFLAANQAIALELDGSVEKPDAYDAEKVMVMGMLLRDFTPSFQGGVGVGYKYSMVEQFNSRDYFGNIIFPVQLLFDYRDDKLNPVKGGQLFGRTAFYENTIGSENFWKTQAEIRKYFMLINSHRLSSAFRLTLGSIDGASIETVPADERFYAGGGGSIRGYEYQGVGPSVNGTPTGGNKLLEFSAELRLQPGNRLGYVAFIDGGTVYNDFNGTDYSRSLRYGAGLGLRWFTTIGPLRADLAYPLNSDSTQKERIQFYISLGQAF